MALCTPLWAFFSRHASVWLPARGTPLRGAQSATQRQLLLLIRKRLRFVLRLPAPPVMSPRPGLLPLPPSALTERRPRSAFPSADADGNPPPSGIRIGSPFYRAASNPPRPLSRRFAVTSSSLPLASLGVTRLRLKESMGLPALPPLVSRITKRE